MKTALNTAIFGLSFIFTMSCAWGQSQPVTTSEKVLQQGPRANAALILSSGESPTCRLGNINDAYVVTVSASNKPGLLRYISGSGEGSCVVLPLAVPVGTQITVTGVLQNTTAVPGGAPASNTISTTEDCFNIEGFSVGLSANNASEYDPADPANIINTQGYGFFWYDSDNDLKPGPYSYTVAGCSGQGCPTATTYYNTDTVPGIPTSCTVLSSFPAVAQKEPLR
jgi:hypothetical protein